MRHCHLWMYLPLALAPVCCLFAGCVVTNSIEQSCSATFVCMCTCDVCAQQDILHNCCADVDPATGQCVAPVGTPPPTEQVGLQIRACEPCRPLQGSEACDENRCLNDSVVDRVSYSALTEAEDGGCASACAAALTNQNLLVLSCNLNPSFVPPTFESITDSCPPGDPLISANGSPESDSLQCTGVGADGGSNAIVTEFDSKGNITATAATGAPCGAELEDDAFNMTFFLAQAQSQFVLGNDTLSGVALRLVNPATGAIGSSGAFTFDGVTTTLLGDGYENGQFNALLVNPNGNITGTYNRPAGVWNASLDITSADGTLNLQMSLVGNTTNRVPVAVVAPPIFAACIDGLVEVTLDGSGSFDYDGTPVAAYLWFDETRAIGSGATITVPLPLGMHQVSLYAWDQQGFGIATTPIQVQNRTPPEITNLTATPSCLWPPNHEMVLYRLGTGIQATVQSSCDPSPTVVISGVQDNQPFLGGGSGNTTPDFLDGTAAVCLRAERDGTIKTPRVYTVTVTATDHEGNSSTANATVTVPHDQGGGKCPDVEPSLVVPDGDPACTANIGSDPSTPTPNRGCNSAGGTPALAALWSTLVVARRRRRKRA
jgi:uncharacterized protein (TIGR03382 family)